MYINVNLLECQDAHYQGPSISSRSQKPSHHLITIIQSCTSDVQTYQFMAVSAKSISKFNVICLRRELTWRFKHECNRVCIISSLDSYGIVIASTFENLRHTEKIKIFYINSFSGHVNKDTTSTKCCSWGVDHPVNTLQC